MILQEEQEGMKKSKDKDGEEKDRLQKHLGFPSDT